MPELMTAQFYERKLNIFDLVDADGHYIEELRREYRLASQAGELRCPACGGVLELCAGAIVPPYFRHRMLAECQITRELATVAGKRRYANRRFLYGLAKEKQAVGLTIEEGKSEWPFVPVMFEQEGQRFAFIYLDGKSRNYEKLNAAQQYYQKNNTKAVWFLNKKYQSHSINLSSDEAEIGRLNGGTIFYLEEGKGQIDIRRSYENAYGQRFYFTKTVSSQKVWIRDSQLICDDYEKEFSETVAEVKLKIHRVLRIPLEDGIDEAYFDFSYVYMDSLMEIWILPPFLYAEAGGEERQRAEKNRCRYLEEQNERLSSLTKRERRMEAEGIASMIDREFTTWRWC